MVELIKERQESLKELLNLPNERLDFFDKVITENNLSCLSGIIDVNVMDVMVAYLLTFSDKISPSKLKDILENIKLEISSDDLFKE